MIDLSWMPVVPHHRVIRRRFYGSDYLITVERWHFVTRDLGWSPVIFSRETRRFVFVDSPPGDETIAEAFVRGTRIANFDALAQQSRILYRSWREGVNPPTRLACR